MILAYKDGTLIAVKPTDNPEVVEEIYGGTKFLLKAHQTHRKLFEGDRAVDDAIAWIEAK